MEDAVQRIEEDNAGGEYDRLRPLFCGCISHLSDLWRNCLLQWTPKEWVIYIVIRKQLNTLNKG